MNLKKLFVAFVLLATTAIAGAQNSNKYVISTEPLSVISAGTVDDKIVNQAGMTGKAVRLMLDKMLYERAGISLNQLVTEGTKSPIVLGLEATGALIWNETQKPDPLKNRTFAKENITTDDSVILSPVRGAYRESNPNRRFHKPQC